MRLPLQDLLLILLTGSALAACSSAVAANPRDVADANDTGNAIGAKDASERSVLERLPALPTDRTERIGALSVTAAAPYAAASGCTCRALAVRPNSGQPPVSRLACTKGGAWFFVPDVFAGGPVAE